MSALTFQSLFLMQDTYQPIVVANKDNYQFTKL
jgi:hypothetical protein